MQNKMTNSSWALFSLLFLFAWISTGCQTTSQDVSAQESTSETITAFIGNLSASTGATGKLTTLRTADLMLNASGQVTAVPVAIGDNVKQGDVLVQLNTTALNRAVVQAEQNVLSATSALADLQKPPTPAELLAAETAVASAQTQLNKLKTGPTEDEIAAAQANVQAAEAAVWAAMNRLNRAQNGAPAADVQTAQMQVDEAQRQYDSAHAAFITFSDCTPNDSGTHDCTLDKGKEGHEAVYWHAAEAQANLERAQAVFTQLRDGNPDSIAVAQASVSVAAAQRDAAQARLDLLLAGATDYEIATAEAELSRTQARLIKLQDGPKPEQIAVAQAQLEQARLTLAQAQHDLEKGTLLAPFAGVITAVHVREGEQSAGPAITLVDNQKMVLALKVNEIDLRHIKLGQTAEVRLEAWPDELLTGTINMITAENQPQATSNAVVYIVHLLLDETDLPLRLGLTGNADLILAERNNVLLLPNRAINTNLETGESFVNLVIPGQEGQATEPVQVTVGARNSQFTEILNGLEAGNQVLVIAAPPPTENNIFEE